MQTFQLNAPGLPFVTDPVDVSTGGWVQICLIQLGGNKQGGQIDLVNTGSGALTHLKLTHSAYPSGHALGKQEDWQTDTDFDTPDSTMPATSTGVETLAGGAKGFIKLDELQGCHEIGVWAQGATTLQVLGSFA